MGLYLALNEDKLSWCKANEAQTPENTLPVCYLNNGAFDCVALGFSVTEIKRLKAGRPDGTWFIVPKSILRKVTPGGETLKELA